MLYTENGILFDYKHRKLDNQKQFKEMKVKKNGASSFLLDNSTLSVEEIKNLEQWHLDEIGNTINEKTDITNGANFVTIVNSVSSIFERRDLIFYINVLYSLGYKASDIIKLNQKEIVQVFVMEVAYNKKTLDKDYIFNNLKIIFDENIANNFVESFGLTAVNKLEEDNELKELSEALSQL